MKYYLLFGEMPCTHYDNDDMDAVVECLKIGDGALYMHHQVDSAIGLLDAFNGYLDYRVLDKSEYSLLRKEVGND